ncbi:hypothetical protein L218DRAFT_866542 [Marasmius fiardii PR-910]|nr:hypothetical protein L218DRAFT_866542 [Marasmius fiardii PR-910]
MSPQWNATVNLRVEDDPAITEHISALNLPELPSAPEPPMMLQALGSFATAWKFKRRMNNIFGGENIFLLNTSETGKTRILFEGLCHHWGFYFTSAIDTTYLGIHDLEIILKYDGNLRDEEGFISPSRHDPRSAELLERNLSITHRCFSATLLSRLLVFKLFLTVAVAHGLTEEYKMIWLKIQLQLWPDLLIHFEGIARNLFQLLPRKEDFDIAISETLAEILAIKDITTDGPIFIALDEANYASRSMEGYFVDRDGNHYSALKAILNTWKHHLDHPRYAFVVG